MKTHEANLEKRYASWLKQVIDLVQPKNLKLVAGRGTAKTSDILAERTMDVCYDMPRAIFALVADTYVNSLTNIVPTLLEGWNRKGWIEGIHYVTDVRPPDHFDLPYKPVKNYKHTISVFNGCLFVLGSLDRISSLAGPSYQHIFGDEVKYDDPEKLKRLMPALRGYAEYSHSVFYRGLTFLTDMPNVIEGDYDWILEGKKEMDQEKIELALRAGIEVNKIKKKIKWAADRNKKQVVESQINLLQKWMVRWAKARKDTTFFYIVSSFVNADILSNGYFSDQLKALGIEEFKSSILSFKTEVKKGEKFYTNLAEHHFITDDVDYKYVDKFSIKDNFKPDCRMLRYYNPNDALDAGLDFGNMTSIVFGQEIGKCYYAQKNIHVLAPESSKELAKRVIDFYEPHQRKEINLYYDRSGNQYSQIKRDWATEIKDHIENYEGTSTGWTVHLLSKGQKTLFQEAEFKFMQKFMGNYYKDLPELRICQNQCKELKSSLELTKITTKKDKAGSTTIQKDKNTEKLPLSQLPMYSSNYSDAFKYLIMRDRFIEMANREINTGFTEPSIF